MRFAQVAMATDSVRRFGGGVNLILLPETLRHAQGDNWKGPGSLEHIFGRSFANKGN